MKKILSLLLALSISICLFGCKGESAPETTAKPPHPFTLTYETIDEVVAVISENYNGTAKHDEMLAENESIYKYFLEENADLEIWRLLDEAKDSKLYMRDIYQVYKACNAAQKSNWYNRINVGMGTPFVHYSSETLTPSRLADAIRKKFVDPDSVEVREAKIGYVMPEGTTDRDGFTYFDEDIHYYIFAEIYASNAYGGRTSNIYCITGRVGYLPASVSEFFGSSVQDIAVSAAFSNNGCGNAWLIFD